MLIQPKFRGFICTTAHPEGCHEQVRKQIAYVKQKGKFTGPKNVLVIGASTGYGLASRIANTFGAGAATLGVFYERPSVGQRTASAGWYNTAAFELEANAAGYKAVSINGDAFSNEIKNQAIDVLQKQFGPVDCIVYSLASPKRAHPDTGEIFSSVLKPIGQPYISKTVDFHSANVSEVSIAPATEEEIAHTVAVMGGDDWVRWIKALRDVDLIAPGAITVAYSYIGPELTYPIYRAGTVGRAKDHLEAASLEISNSLSDIQGQAYVSVNKAVVTQSSSAIPVVPLYMSLLFKIMEEKKIDEGCIEQMARLFAEEIYGNKSPLLDEAGRIRIDNLEMLDEVQQEVAALWKKVDSSNITQCSDITGYREGFFKLFGFGDENVDYSQETDPDIKIPSIG